MGLPGLLFTQHTVGLWIGSSKALLHRRARVPQRLPLGRHGALEAVGAD